MNSEKTFRLAKRKIKKIINKQKEQKDRDHVSRAKVTTIGVVRMTRFRQRLDLSKSLSWNQTKVSRSNETTRNCSSNITYGQVKSLDHFKFWLDWRMFRKLQRDFCSKLSLYCFHLIMHWLTDHIGHCLLCIKKFDFNELNDFVWNILK